MSTAILVRPTDLTMVSLPDVPGPVVDLLVGPHRSEEMAAVGMALADQSTVSIEMLTGAVASGFCRAWVAFLGERPVGFSMYSPTSLPNVWSGEVINAPKTGDLRGVGTATMARAIDLVFGEVGARRIFGFVSAANPAALRLVERLGYTKEGRAERLLERPDGTEVDAFLFRLHRDEWPGSSVRLGDGR